MTDLDISTDAPDAPVDGRVARRQRNIDAVLDVVIEMFGEDALFPTIEQVATRSGLSLRSLYRYFADPGELLKAVIARSRERGQQLIHIEALGEGSFDHRVSTFVTTRLALHDAFGTVYRATVANEARHPRISEERAANRNGMRIQFEEQFRPELDRLDADRRRAVLTAGDLLTQMDSLEYLRRHQGMSVSEAETVLVEALVALLR